MKKLNQFGFSLIETVLAVSVIALIVFISVNFLQNQRKIDIPSANNSSGVENSLVDNFIKSHNFPELRSADLLYEDRVKDVRIFEVSYGKPNDCPSGCFYSRGVGLAYGNKIGWIELYDYDNKIEEESVNYYVLSDGDEYLASEVMTNKLSNLDRNLYITRYRRMLADYDKTPDQSLNNFVNAISEDNDVCLAMILLNNPRIKSNKQLYEKVEKSYNQFNANTREITLDECIYW